MADAGSTTGLLLHANVGDEGEPTAKIFLCHNRNDAALVALTADALEIETGTSFFLDRFAIPTGVAFLPKIEQAIAQSEGCAIFLGANGWGETHLYEAERALERYRADPDYRLVPVALPGIREGDKKRLGSGSVFEKINCAMLTSNTPDLAELLKLSHALNGTAAPQYRGPSTLSAYQMRRDAERWRDETDNKKQRSILYKGEQLAEARMLALASPDFAVLGQVHPFLDAAEAAQTRTWRTIALCAVLVALVVSVISFIAIYTAAIAEQRRLESLSRALAITAPSDSVPGRQLLIAMESYQRAATPEARGVVMDMLERWDQLRGEHSLFHRLETMVADRSGTFAWVSSGDGEIHKIGPDGVPELAHIVKEGVTSLFPSKDGLLVGTWRNRVLRLIDNEEPQELFAAVDTPVNASGFRADPRSSAIVEHRDGNFVVVGDRQGFLRIRRKNEKPTLLVRDLSDDLRIERMALTPDGTVLVVATGSNRLVFFDTSSWEELSRWPLRTQIEDIVFLDDEQLVWIDQMGLLQRACFEAGNITIKESNRFEGSLTVAVIEPVNGLVALGRDNGFIEIADFYGGSAGLTRMKGHADSTEGLAFLSSSNVLVSASRTGDVAQWTVESNPGAGSQLADVGSGNHQLNIARGGIIHVSTFDEDEAYVQRMMADGKVKVLDIVAQTRAILGEGSLVRLPAKPDREGFISLDNDLIRQVSLSDEGVAWSTFEGQVFYKSFDHASKISIMDYEALAPPFALSHSSASGLIALFEGGALELRVFESGSGKQLTPISLPTPARSITFSANGEEIAVGFDNGTVGTVPARGGDVNLMSTGHDSSAAHISYAETGNDLVSAGDGTGQVRGLLVHRGNGGGSTRLQSRLPGGAVQALAVGEDMDLIAMGDMDGRIGLWRKQDLRPITWVFLRGGPISGIAIDAKHKRLVALSSAGKLQSWTLDPVQWVKTICAKVGRSLNILEWQELMNGQEYDPVCVKPDEGEN